MRDEGRSGVDLRLGVLDSLGFHAPKGVQCSVVWEGQCPLVHIEPAVVTAGSWLVPRMLPLLPRDSSQSPERTGSWKDILLSYIEKGFPQ